jgi:hypothetical protein
MPLQLARLMDEDEIKAQLPLVEKKEAPEDDY